MVRFCCCFCLATIIWVDRYFSYSARIIERQFNLYHFYAWQWSLYCLHRVDFFPLATASHLLQYIGAQEREKIGIIGSWLFFPHMPKCLHARYN